MSHITFLNHTCYFNSMTKRQNTYNTGSDSSNEIYLEDVIILDDSDIFKNSI